jgi:LysM repeat protein
MKKASMVVLISLVLVLVGAQMAWAAPARPAGDAKPTCGACTYWVKKGDTLYSIARRYGTTIWELKRCNRIRNVNRIYRGQRLWVPCKQKQQPSKNCREVYRVRPGDTLTRIAWRHCSSVQAIATRNGIYNWNLIYSGQKLCIPKKPNYCR